jgi:prepilin-type N-terminal cleavage/methylation domain-containing protein
VYKTGFTLIEVIVTLTILGVILGFTAPVAWSFFQRVELSSEIKNHIAYLKLARSYAMANRSQSSHGAFIATTSTTIFQGGSYAARDTSRDLLFPRSRIVTATSTIYEIVFSPLSGTTTPATTTISNIYGSREIVINSEGKIE